MSFGGKSVVIPIFTLDGNLQSGSVVFNEGVLDSARASIVQSTIGGSTHSPFARGEDYYTPDKDCWITSTTSQNYYTLRTQDYAIYISGNNSPWGAYLVMYHYGENYWCHSQLSRSESIEKWEAFAMTNAATDSSFGLCVKNNLAAFNNTSPQTYPGIQSANITAMKVIGNKLMNVAEDVSTDPYNNSGSSSGGGGGGGGGLDSVSGSDVSDPDLPILSAVSTGLISIYTPTLAQLQSLGNFLWSDAFSVDSFKKIFSDPWDAILGLSILGVGVSGGTDTEVHIGNIDTDIYMPKLSSQYYKFNCGSITLKETWGSYLDYNPYTKVSIYLPFIGTHALNVDDIMGRTISLKYNIDILSGACVANIQCGGTVLYSFTGSCSATIPLSGSSYTNMINGILGVATSIGSMVATGGASAPLAVPAMASSVVNSAKTDVSHSGNVSGMSGIMGVKSAFLIMEVPRICIPKSQDKYVGYPTYTTKKVGSLSGYCVFEDIKVRGNSHATIGEVEEIENIMKEGVYL